MSVITFFIVIALNETWVTGLTFKLIGMSQIIIMEIPDATFNLSFNSMMRRYSNNEIGGTFVSMLDCIFYLGKYFPTTLLLILIQYTG